MNVISVTGNYICACVVAKYHCSTCHIIWLFLFAILMSPTTDEYPDKERLNDFCKTQKVLFHVKVPRAAGHGISLQQEQRKCVEARMRNGTHVNEVTEETERRGNSCAVDIVCPGLPW